MPIKLKDIPGLMLEKKYKVPGKGCICAAYGECECGCGADWTNYTTYNKAISKQGKVSIGLNRDKLAKLIYEKWENTAYKQADAIIAQEANLIEFVQADKERKKV